MYLPSKKTLMSTGRGLAPALLALAISAPAHAQGTIDFSGAQSFLQSIKGFALFAGAVACFVGLIWAGVRGMSGGLQEAIPGLVCALFGAGVVGWATLWTGSLTGQAL